MKGAGAERGSSYQSQTNYHYFLQVNQKVSNSEGKREGERVSEWRFKIGREGSNGMREGERESSEGVEGGKK